ncbi:MAG: MotA/TolQ/ExbB proton channel family protein [Chloroflexi bacterium]|nr:MotA/TolQ/ExbB proton channel family protein [Chloroflexota bacterium]
MIINGLKMLVQQGGATMVVIMGCSVLCLAVVLERAFSLAGKNIDLKKLWTKASPLLESGNAAQAKHLLTQLKSKSPVFQSLAKDFTGREPAENDATISLEDESLDRERFLPVLATLSVVSPFIGLFGTVIGIMNTFSDIAAQGTTNPSVVSRGVAEALVNTAGGMLVAIIAVVFYNIFRSWNKNYIKQLRIFASRWIETAYKNGGDAK